MTVKRDFKRRVRQRQARTGESYVTARRHLLASRPSHQDDDDHDEGGGPQPRRISVVELIDVSDEARRIGLACRVLMFPSLVERIAPDRVLAPFVIGRSRVCDVVIDADGVADEHAAVILRGTAVYFKDLGSPDGIVYRGMRIDNKRIAEGDVFHIGGHEIGFTFHADSAAIR